MRGDVRANEAGTLHGPRSCRVQQSFSQSRPSRSHNHKFNQSDAMVPTAPPFIDLRAFFPSTPAHVLRYYLTPGNAFRVSDDLDLRMAHHGTRVMIVEAVKEDIVRALLGDTNQGITNVSTALHPIRSFTRASPRATPRRSGCWRHVIIVWGQVIEGP